MNKKDYQLLANAFVKAHSIAVGKITGAKACVIRDVYFYAFAEALKIENQNFDISRFAIACDITL